MRLLLDTVTFLWAARSLELISKRAAPLLQDESVALYLSSISISEIAIKYNQGKLDFNWIDTRSALANLEVEVLPYTAIHAQRLFGLPLRHKDPFDWQIIAQALAEAMPVVTVDPFFKLYEGVDVLW